LLWKLQTGTPDILWELVKPSCLEEVTPELYFRGKVELGEISAEQNLGNTWNNAGPGKNQGRDCSILPECRVGSKRKK
jgi:hypothetical protein